MHSNLIMEVKPTLKTVIKNRKYFKILFLKNTLIHSRNKTSFVHSI